MTAGWSYFWPLFALGLALGLLGGIIGLRRTRPPLFIVAAALLALGGAALWQGPLGAADRLVGRIEQQARTTLVDFEMTQVQAHLHRAPLTRRLLLSGPADDFQRSELVRIMSAIPGVSSATWSNDAGMPLLLEGEIVAAAGFLLGLLLAYGVELRRRYNAQWSW